VITVSSVRDFFFFALPPVAYRKSKRKTQDPKRKTQNSKWLPDSRRSIICSFVTREIPGLRMFVGPELVQDSLHRLRLFLDGSTTRLTVHGIAKLVLTFRGARALPEVAVKALGFRV
jgi:hypothetical protein